MGTVDEANGVIGVARIEAAKLTDGTANAALMRIQNDLFDLGADLCMPGEDKEGDIRLRITPGQVKRLEKEIDAMNADLAPLTSFILPGGAPAAAISISAAAPSAGPNANAGRWRLRIMSIRAVLQYPEPAQRPSVRHGPLDQPQNRHRRRAVEAGRGALSATKQETLCSISPRPRPS